jgi:hypothetical protein
MSTQHCKTFAGWNLFHSIGRFWSYAWNLAALRPHMPESVPGIALEMSRQPNETKSLAGGSLLDNAGCGG